jgi:hypothetical protein
VRCAPLILAAASTAFTLSPPSPSTSTDTSTRAPAAHDTLRRGKVEIAPVSAHVVGGAGRVVSGYLSSRGLPPIHGIVTISDTGLMFEAGPGTVATFPLVGPIQQTAGRRWRPSTVSLAYTDRENGRPVYVFRIEAGVFETEDPGFLLDLSTHPRWLDSLAPTQWSSDRHLVDASDSVAIQRKTRNTAASSYADTLYQLFGRPRAAIGIIGPRGRTAGRLGEYSSTRDSLALDPGQMTGEAQLRHTLAHELGHRWQSRAPAQLSTLWWGVGPIRDPKRYGYGDVSEHQAEAVAFAINFLQTTASPTASLTDAMTLLDHYELLVPGTRTMVRYLSLQPVYRSHPLRFRLTTGGS